MSSLAANYINLPKQVEAAGLPLGSTILWMSTKSIPANCIAMLGQTPADLVAFPALLTLFPDGLPNTEHRFVRGAGPSRPVVVLEDDAIRNITGGLVDILASTNPSGSGVFTRTANLAGYTDQTVRSGKIVNFSFDASKVVPTAAENRPINISAFYIVKATPSLEYAVAETPRGNLLDAFDLRYEKKGVPGRNFLDNPMFQVSQRPSARRMPSGTAGSIFFADRWHTRKGSETGCPLPENKIIPGNSSSIWSSYLALTTTGLGHTPTGDFYLSQIHYIGKDNLLGEWCTEKVTDLAFSLHLANCNGDQLLFKQFRIELIEVATSRVIATAASDIVDTPVNNETPSGGIANSWSKMVIRDVRVRNIKALYDTELFSDNTEGRYYLKFYIDFRKLGAGTYRFIGAKLEAGTKSTPLVMPDFQAELAKCKKYYELLILRSSATNNTGNANRSDVVGSVSVTPKSSSSPIFNTFADSNIATPVANTLQYLDGISSGFYNVAPTYVNANFLPTIKSQSTVLCYAYYFTALQAAHKPVQVNMHIEINGDWY